METEHLNRSSGAQHSSLKIGLIVGIVWAVAQFVISESLYRVATQSDYELLYDMSDTVAWPAGELYYAAELDLFEEVFATIEGTPEERKKWDELLVQVRDPENETAYDTIWEIFDANDLEPYVDITTEYSIYIGVCIVWGALIGSLAGAWHFIRKGM